MTDAKFEFIAGSPALCFVDTLGGRGGVPIERLATPDDLLTWIEAAHLFQRIGQQATPGDLRTARELREAVHRCGLAAMKGKALPEDDIDLINHLAARPPLRPQLVDGMLKMQADNPVQATLSTLAADALSLLGSDARKRIRECPECRMMFVDTSRPGRRRWCSSASGCGNRAKIRTMRARKAGRASGDVK